MNFSLQSMLFLKSTKIVVHISQIIYRKLNASNSSLIILKPQQIMNNFHNLMIAFKSNGGPTPSIVKKLNNKLFTIFKNYNLGKAQLTVSQNQQSLIETTMIEYFEKQLSFKKTNIQKNIEAAKSLSRQLNITEIQQIIQQQKDVCLGCMKSLEQGKLILKTNQLYSIVIGISINDFLQDNVKKKTCALLNDQGGYLFIIKSIKKNKMIGLALNEEELYQLREFVFKTIKNSIFPNTFEIKIDKINVIQQQTQNQNTFSQKTQIEKSILRVSLRPNGRDGLYFVKKEVLNYPSVFSCYFLNLNAVGQINDVRVLEKAESIYKILLKHRSLKNTEQIVHKLDCVGRNNAMQHLFNQIDRHSAQKMNLVNILEAGPLIKYHNQSILILSSQADDQYIPSIKRAMELKKMGFFFSKSYQFCRSNSMKSMWFISHQQNLNDLHSIIVDVIANKNKTFTLITCTKYLLIEKKQKSCLKEYKTTFQQYFQKYLIIYGVLIDTPYDKQQIYDIYVKFESLSESYFSFMLLDDHRIRSKFVKEQKFNAASNKKLLKVV